MNCTGSINILIEPAQFTCVERCGADIYKYYTFNNSLETLCLSIIMYGNEACGLYNRVQYGAMRFSFGVHTYTPIHGLYGMGFYFYWYMYRYDEVLEQAYEYKQLNWQC